jgi:hypothetical protein
VVDNPNNSTLLLALSWSFLFFLFYLPDFPTSAMFTTRYLVPILPLLFICLSRFGFVRRALKNENLIAWSSVSTVLIGGQVTLAYFSIAAPPVDGALQIHGLVSHLLVSSLVIWGIINLIVQRDLSRFGSFLVGLAIGATTVFLLFTGIEHLSYSSDYLLPVVSSISEVINI